VKGQALKPLKLPRTLNLGGLRVVIKRENPAKPLNGGCFWGGTSGWGLCKIHRTDAKSGVIAPSLTGTFAVMLRAASL